jgi:hypothetical protein
MKLWNLLANGAVGAGVFLLIGIAGASDIGKVAIEGILRHVLLAGGLIALGGLMKREERHFKMLGRRRKGGRAHAGAKTAVPAKVKTAVSA